MRKSLMIKCVVLLAVFCAVFTFLGSIYSVNSFALESHAVSSINSSSNSYQGKSADNTDVAECMYRDEIHANDTMIQNAQQGILTEDDIDDERNSYSSFDITSHSTYGKYFPAIGDQGELPSCQAFSIVYYAFTYAAHKLNNITTTTANTYSPKWAYNANNCYEPNYSYKLLLPDLEDILNFTKEHGALTNSTFPYNFDPNNTATYTELPDGTYTNAMCEALKTRISSWTKYSISEDNVTTSTLDVVRNRISSGTPLIAEIATAHVTTAYNSTLNRYVITRTADGGAHMVVLVGYNDNIWVDINSNGVAESDEYGAFKVASSNGTDLYVDGLGQWYTNYTGSNCDGYFWVSYDALRETSAVDGNWESGMLYTRVPAFSSITRRIYSDFKNYFTVVTAMNYKAYYVAKLSVSNQACHDLMVDIGCATGYYSSKASYGCSTKVYPGSSAPNITYSELVFCYDLGQTSTNLTLNRYYWLQTLKYGNTNVSCTKQIVDTLGNITHFTQKNSNVYLIKNVMGDVNYSGVLDSGDVTIILQYLAGMADLSSLQFFLADRNGDGIVTSGDASGYLNDILNQ